MSARNAASAAYCAGAEGQMKDRQPGRGRAVFRGRPLLDCVIALGHWWHPLAAICSEYSASGGCGKRIVHNGRMAELNERIDKEAKAAGFGGIQDLAGTNVIGGTTRPSQLARPAGPEQAGRGAEAYSREPGQSNET